MKSPPSSTIAIPPSVVAQTTPSAPRGARPRRQRGERGKERGENPAATDFADSTEAPVRQGDEDGALGSSEGPVTRRRQPYPTRRETPRSSLTTPFFAPLPYKRQRVERRKLRVDNPYLGPAAGRVRQSDDRARDLPAPRVAILLTDPNPPFSPWRRDAEPFPRRKAQSGGCPAVPQGSARVIGGPDPGSEPPASYPF